MASSWAFFIAMLAISYQEIKCQNIAQNYKSKSSINKLEYQINQQSIVIKNQKAMIEDLAEKLAQQGEGMEDMRDELDELKRKTLQIPIHPVASPRGYYQLTYQEAGEICESLGETLATYEQLQIAFGRGLSHCACGWLSNGRAAYPMMYTRTGCGKKGINICGHMNPPRYNAWCAYND